ncbi:MAG: epimerase [Microbacteriaceae bacterium]|jgi:UDP-glucose 4-epimerase|nr:epimerase [Microbacteriaceae bacterium]
MRVAIVGATGIIGSALRRRLRDEPQVTSILGISRSIPTGNDPDGRVEWRRVDIGMSDARSVLAEAFTGVDVVINVAALARPAHGEAEVHRTNVRGTAHVLGAVADAGVPHVVAASSVGAYSSDPERPCVDENWPTDGSSAAPPASENAAVESMLDTFTARFPSVVVSRVRSGPVLAHANAAELEYLVFGPRTLAPTSPARVGRGSRARVLVQPVLVDDMADAYWRIISIRAPGAFNIATRDVVDLTDRAHALGVVSAVGIPDILVRLIARPPRAASVGWLDIATHSPIMSVDRARTVLGWTATPATVTPEFAHER